MLVVAGGRRNVVERSDLHAWTDQQEGVVLGVRIGSADEHVEGQPLEKPLTTDETVLDGETRQNPSDVGDARATVGLVLLARMD